jgi:hypothetical protein
MPDEILESAFLEPTEEQKQQLHAMEAQRLQQLGRKSVLSASQSEARAAKHQALLERFPEPWTIENLGPVNYYIVAKEGDFFDPLREPPRFRPPLDRYIPPESFEAAQRLQSERVKLGVEARKAINASAR